MEKAADFIAIPHLVTPVLEKRSRSRSRRRRHSPSRSRSRKRSHHKERRSHHRHHRKKRHSRSPSPKLMTIDDHKRLLSAILINSQPPPTGWCGTCFKNNCNIPTHICKFGKECKFINKPNKQATGCMYFHTEAEILANKTSLHVPRNLKSNTACHYGFKKPGQCLNGVTCRYAHFPEELIPSY